MSKLRSRMTRDMQLAGLAEDSRREYPRAVRPLAAYYMIAPDQLSERNVEACVLLILATPADTAQPLKITSLSDALSQLAEPTDQALDEAVDHYAALPICPHCGSCRTRFLGEYPRFGVP